MKSLWKVVLRLLRWEVTFSLWGLYEHLRSHFLLLKFSSRKHSSNSLTVTFFRYLVGISSLKWSKILPSIAVRTSLWKLSVWNCDFGKLSCFFISNMISLSRLLPTYFTSDSNSFLIEFILIWPMITLYGFLFLRCFSSRMSYIFFHLLIEKEDSLINLLLYG